VQEFTWPTSTTAYGYDQAGDLTSIQRPAAEGVPAINESLAYDATGLLAAKTTGTLTHQLSWDASTSLPLLLNDGEDSFIYGPGGLPVEQIDSAGEPTYLHHDQLGSTRLLTDASGKAAGAFSYAPYGGVEAKTGTASTPLGFAGQYTDAESGLQYLRARFYDPGTGQFLSRDPLEALTREPYPYAGDNPLRFTDPSGLSITEDLEGFGVPLPCVECAGEGVLELFEPAYHDAGWVLQHSLGVEELDEKPSDESQPCNERRNTGDQDALIQLGKEARRNGLSEKDAETFKEWAEEYEVPFRGPETHPKRGFGANPHIHVGPINHIPVR
jgi:RHS repeat-associated protein